MTEETDDAFLARIRPPFIARWDLARLAEMMAAEARRLGDVEAADRLLGEAAATRAPMSFP